MVCKHIGGYIYTWLFGPIVGSNYSSYYNSPPGIDDIDDIDDVDDVDGDLSDA